MHEEKRLSDSFGIENVDCVRVSRNKDFHFSYRHGRKSNGFIFLKRGKMRYSFLDADIGELDLTEGMLLFVPQGARYESIYLEDNTQIIIVQFDIMAGALPTALTEPVIIPTGGAEELIRSVVEHPDPTEVGDSRQLYHAFRVYELIWRSIGALENRGGDALRLAPALAELRKNYAEQRRVGYYAALCFMSETGFRRHFLAYTGMSPVAYRNKLRLEEADRLIRSGEYTVEEAASLVGFFNLSFFCRAYRAAFGHTPTGRE